MSEDNLNHLISPKHCFCEIPEENMRPWVIKKYKEKTSTMELLNSTNNPMEKEIISIVALLDVNDDIVIKMMGDVDKPSHHIVHCRENVKKMLGL